VFIVVVFLIALSVVVGIGRAGWNAHKNATFESQYHPNYAAYDVDLPGALGQDFMSHITLSSPLWTKGTRQMGDGYCQARYEKVSEAAVRAEFDKDLGAASNIPADQATVLFDGVSSTALRDLCP
jgi:hypothetical protein